MKKILRVLAGLALLAALSSCSKSSDNSPETQQPFGKPTAVGVALNNTVSRKQIGPAGGEIVSADGRIKLLFPDGALQVQQQISITTISNENPLGTGVAYRLEPHGTQFQKPVQVVFHYKEEDHKNSLPELLGIAYQDDARIWHAVGGVLNKANKTYTVSTTHFSDWSFFETCKLIASATTVGVNGNVDLEVQSAGFLAPLVPGEDAGIGDVVDYTHQFIKKWNLAGAGRLTPNKTKAVYKAPSVVPNAPNPVAVSVEMDFKQKGKFLLLAHITIVDDDGEIEISVGGGAINRHPASPAVKFADGIYGFANSDGDEVDKYVMIMWQGGVGTHGIKSPYDQLGTSIHYQYTPQTSYVSMWLDTNGEVYPSTGGITITDMGNDSGFVEGTFDVGMVGIGPMLLATTTLKGKFRVRRSFQE